MPDRVEKALDRFRHVTMIAVVAVLAVAALSWWDTYSDNRRQDDSRLSDAISACERGNVTRTQINLGNDAQVAIAEAVEANRAALEAAARQAVAVPPGVTLTSEQQARLDAFLAVVAEQNAHVLDLLTTADEKITAAVLPMRDCDADVVLDNPNATIPPRAED